MNNKRNFELCENELDIAEKCNNILKKYNMVNDKEYKKKKYELFHFLCFLKYYNNDIEYIEIKPNEPGDFILIDKNGKSHMYEVFTIFGDIENKTITNKLDLIFGSKSDIEIKNEKFDDEKFFCLLMKKLNDKNKKNYFISSEHESNNILIIFSEFDRCANCGAWYLRLHSKELDDFLKNKNFSKVYSLDYAASGKDNGPIGSDLETELELVIKYFGYN